MKAKENNLINILNLILLIIVSLLIIISMCLILLKKREFNVELGKINSTIGYSNNESNIQLDGLSNTSEDSFENNVYYEFDGKTLGTIKLEQKGKTYDMNNVYDRYRYGDSNAIFSLDKVSSSIKEGTLTKSGVTIIIKDENKYPYGYSKKWYSIEKKNGKEWNDLKLKKDMDISEKEDEPTIYADISEILINWTEYYGKLEKGIYRIAKKAYIYDNINNSNNESGCVYTEFEIIS